MERGKVLLRKIESGSYVELGLITARQGRSLTVRTRDGVVAKHERHPGDLTPTAGSYFHVLRLAPDAIERLLREDPARVLKQLINDSPNLTARELKAKLGPTLAAASDAAWDRAKPLLDADEDVIASEAREPKYRLREGAQVDLLDLVWSAPGTSSPQQFPASGAAPGEVEPADEVDRTGEEHAVESAAATKPSLVDQLGLIAADLGLRSRSDVARNLLAVGSAVARMSVASQAALVAALDADERRLLAMATGGLKGDLLTDEVGSLGAADYEAALDAGLREVASRPGDAKGLTRALGRLLDRAAATHPLPPELLTRLAKAFAERGTDEADLENCLVRLSEALASMSAGDLARLDLRGLARATCSAPFARTGGRVRLMSTLYRTAPDEVTDARWWGGATLDGLSEAARGVLGPVLEDDRVAQQTVRPLVIAYLDGISSRSGAAAIWGLPLPLARHVTGMQLAHALRRVGAGDALLESWLDTLASTGLVRSLQDKIGALEADVERSEEAAARATAEAEQLRTRLRTTAEQLAATRNADAGNRDAHDRQVRLDAVRALAVLAAQVRQSSAARSDEALMRQVEHACSREGLDEIGVAGETTAYEPERHDALSNGLSPGSKVIVVRGGYTWADGDQKLVLVKAHVVAK